MLMLIWNNKTMLIAMFYKGYPTLEVLKRA